MWTLLAALFLWAHFPSSVGVARSTGPAQPISPKWTATLRAAIGSAPLAVAVGQHEHAGKPKTSLWFIDNGSLVVTFVTRRDQPSPNLSRHGTLDDSLTLRLRALLLDVATGRVTTTTDWPVESRFASIVATHGRRLVTLTGDDLVLYSADLKEIKRLRLPATELAHRPDLRPDLPSRSPYAGAAAVSPTGKSILFTGAALTDKPVTWTWIDSDNLQILKSWQDFPRGPISISDSTIVMTACTFWFYRCEPAVEIRTLDTNWEKVAPIVDRRHPPQRTFCR